MKLTVDEKQFVFNLFIKREIFRLEPLLFYDLVRVMIDSRHQLLIAIVFYF